VLRDNFLKNNRRPQLAVVIKNTWGIIPMEIKEKEMKRMLVLFIPVVFLCLPVSCDVLVIKSGSEEEESPAGDMMAYEAWYNLQVENKAGVAVTVYGPGRFYQSDTYMTLFNFDEELCHIEASQETTTEFVWCPKESLYYSDNPANPDPPAEEIKAMYKPTKDSFFFKFVFENSDEDVYIAGWPESIELPTEPKEEWDTIIPKNKIIQYGFGYAENTEVLIEDGFAYVPFTIKGAAPTEYNFGKAITVYGNAKLTITSASDIHFETLSLSPGPE
jgi:hypothetical protein